MNRIALAACLLTAALGTACQSTLDAPTRMPDTADLRVTASVAGTPIDLIVVICESADIPTPLVFNLPVQNGVAQGTIKLPPGSQRKITVKAYDTDGALIAEGTKTIDVRPGMNPPVSIPMVSKAGQVPVTVTLGAVSVVVQPALPTMTTGGTLQLSTTITTVDGIVLTSDPEWATTNPAIATVDAHGLVTALRPGTVDIVATFEGVAGLAHLTVASQSPAPDQIAFASNRDGPMEIYVMHADGSGAARLTFHNRVAWEPSWSPDGRQIAFVSNYEGPWAIYAMNADGTNEHRLTDLTSDSEEPAWSPDGSKIAFTSDRDFDYEIYVMNADGTGAVRLTNNPTPDNFATWSPDGTRIAFMRREQTIQLTSQIYAMNADGSGVVRISHNLGTSGVPDWSPDGLKISFTSDQSGDYEVYVMNADGSGSIQLTSTPPSSDASWSPDGAKLAFVFSSGGTNGADIYSMNSDGTGIVRLTDNGSADDVTPHWRPR